MSKPNNPTPRQMARVAGLMADGSLNRAQAQWLIKNHGMVPVDGTGANLLKPSRVETVTRAKLPFRQLTYPCSLGKVLEIGKVLVPGRQNLTQAAYFRRLLNRAGLRYNPSFDAVTWQDSSQESREVGLGIIFMEKDYNTEEAEDRISLLGYSRLADPSEGLALAARYPGLQGESHFGCFGTPGSREGGSQAGVIFYNDDVGPWARCCSISGQSSDVGVLVARDIAA